LARYVSDSDSVRRQNRGLVLEALRQHGPLPRTMLAGTTGLSHATITAITQDMVAQRLLIDLPDGEKADSKGRGRPAVRIGFNRTIGYVCLIEIDVAGARLSLVDYGGTLVDRIEASFPPNFFRYTKASDFLIGRIEHLRTRNPTELDSLKRVAISVQGILDRDGDNLKWSPIPHFAGQALVSDLVRALAIPATLYKRGRLLAEGARWLDPELRNANIAAIFVGSTVALGMSGPALGRSEDGATEFGHMNHIPNGALCRCGMRGCIEAYASDYGVLRSAYSVPETTPPAAAVPPAEYDGLIQRALHGDRSAVHAFHLAGRSVGYGLSRLMTVFDPSHVVIMGPGARAFSLMRSEIDQALAASLVCRVNGTPEVRTQRDTSEPIFRGLMMKTLNDLDQTDFATLPAVEARA
jgi:predicted NBD/HSP70 family sugar kinase